MKNFFHNFFPWLFFLLFFFYSPPHSFIEMRNFLIRIQRSNDNVVKIEEEEVIKEHWKGNFFLFVQKRAVVILHLILHTYWQLCLLCCSHCLRLYKFFLFYSVETKCPRLLSVTQGVEGDEWKEKLSWKSLSLLDVGTIWRNFRFLSIKLEKITAKLEYLIKILLEKYHLNHIDIILNYSSLKESAKNHNSAEACRQNYKPDRIRMRKAQKMKRTFSSPHLHHSPFYVQQHSVHWFQSNIKRL